MASSGGNNMESEYLGLNTKNGWDQLFQVPNVATISVSIFSVVKEMSCKELVLVILKKICFESE